LRLEEIKKERAAKFKELQILAEAHDKLRESIGFQWPGISEKSAAWDLRTELATKYITDPPVKIGDDPLTIGFEITKIKCPPLFTIE